ncbi:MAG TPA: hypothetical protein VFG76_06930 [Candidatus Polarisedimenticolia bacterium]|nr:hypothetical protein [Candidatus Polarisedimenticolia bacterium]
MKKSVRTLLSGLAMAGLALALIGLACGGPSHAADYVVTYYYLPG